MGGRERAAGSARGGAGAGGRRAPRAARAPSPLLHPPSPWECAEMALPRSWLNSFCPIAVRTTFTRGENGPSDALLPIATAARARPRAGWVVVEGNGVVGGSDAGGGGRAGSAGGRCAGRAPHARADAVAASAPNRRPIRSITSFPLTWGGNAGKRRQLGPGAGRKRRPSPDRRRRRASRGRRPAGGGAHRQHRRRGKRGRGE